MNTCNSCANYEPLDSTCRHTTPVVMQEVHGATTTYVAKWPVCALTDWCREYEQERLS